MRPTELFKMDPLAGSVPTLLAIGERIHADWLPDADVRFADADQGPELLRRLMPDLVLVDIDAWSPALDAAVAAEAHRPMALVLVADDSQADAAGALMGHRIDSFLDPHGDRLAGRQLMDALAQRFHQADGVSDVGLGAEFDDPLDLLRRDAERIARALAELSASRPHDAPLPRPVTAARIRAHIKARRLRERFFGPDLFADPAWDMLLDLAAARLEQRQVSVSSLCIAAAVPTTTALRWIKTMIDRGHFVRRPDPQDARRAFISLAAETEQAVDACLDAMLNLPGQ